MPPIPGPVTTGGGVTIALRPPLEFILRQSGAFRRKLLNLGPLWDRFAPIMEEIEREQWESRGHGRWPDLSPATLARKQTSDIMVETGELRRSLTDRNRAMDAGAFQMRWGTDVFYAEFHQTGTSRMPQRMVIDLQTEDRRKLEQAQVQFIDWAAAQTWGQI